MESQHLIAQVFDRVLTTGKITAHDRFWLLHTAMQIEYPLNQDVEGKVQKVLDRLQMGLLQIAD